MHRTRIAALAALSLLVAGCETQPIQELRRDFEAIFKPRGKAEETLAAGLRAYDDARYAEAGRLLQSSLDQGLVKRQDEARAHKYLAFIHCVSGRPAQCRAEFQNAFKADSQFDLAPSEAGHPIWGPVFRSVKAQRNR